MNSLSSNHSGKSKEKDKSNIPVYNLLQLLIFVLTKSSWLASTRVNDFVHQRYDLWMQIMMDLISFP